MYTTSFFFYNHSTSKIYTLSLHDALPIYLKMNKSILYLLFVANIFLFSGLILYLLHYQGYQILVFPITLFSTLGFFWAIVHYNYIDLFVRWPYFITLIVITVLFSIGYTAHDFNNLISSGSRNSVSAYIILLGVSYLAICYLREEKVSLIAAVLLVVSNIALYGRTGIALSFILFFISLWIRFGRSSLYLIITGSVLLILFWDSVNNSLILHTKYSQGLHTPRFLMWSSYISSIDLSSIFLGKNTNDIPIIQSYGGNPHNEFIRLHSDFGVVSLFYILIFFASSVIAILEKKFILVALLITYMTRAFFDVAYFYSGLNYLAYIVLLSHMISSDQNTEVQLKTATTNLPS